MEKIHFFWYGETLPDLAKQSIKSFQKYGFTCCFWSYSQFDGLPKGVEICNAADIMNFNSDVNILHFADYFRLKLLYKMGGYWSDLDNICLQPFNINTDYYFVRWKKTINNNFLKAPAGAPVLAWCLAEADRIGWETLDAGNLNFHFLNRAIKQFNLQKHIAAFNWQTEKNKTAAFIRHRRRKLRKKQ